MEIAHAQKMMPRYRALMSSVVIQALMDYQDDLKRHGEKKAKIGSAGHFLLSDDNRVYGFSWICDHLDLNPDRIRSRLNTRGLLAEMRLQVARQRAYENKREQKARMSER